MTVTLEFEQASHRHCLPAVRDTQCPARNKYIRHAVQVIAGHCVHCDGVNAAANDIGDVAEGDKRQSCAAKQAGNQHQAECESKDYAYRRGQPRCYRPLPQCHVCDGRGRLSRSTQFLWRCACLGQNPPLIAPENGGAAQFITTLRMCAQRQYATNQSSGLVNPS